jgi:uncharacterized repeat protein (TIGR01451 family)
MKISLIFETIRSRSPRPGRALNSALALAFALALSSHAFAQGKGDVTVNLTAKKVVVTDGKESLESAGTAKPGDLIQYEAVYRNTTQAAVRNLQAIVPVPQGMALVTDAAKPAAAQASVDGKNFAPMPLTRVVKKADGTSEKEPVPASEYRALRWNVAEISAGGSVAVALRVHVQTNTASK